MISYDSGQTYFWLNNFFLQRNGYDKTQFSTISMIQKMSLLCQTPTAEVVVMFWLICLWTAKWSLTETPPLVLICSNKYPDYEGEYEHPLALAQPWPLPSTSLQQASGQPSSLARTSSQTAELLKRTSSILS